MFSYSVSQLENTVQKALLLAKQGGATSSDISVNEALGQVVTARLQNVEQIEYQQDKSLGVTVYVEQKKGYASTADFSDAAIERTVNAALNIAKYTGEDDCAGLADASLMAKDLGNLQLFYPWHLSVEEAIDLAKECEEAAMSSDARLSNSEGATVNSGHYQGVYANSHGFMANAQSSRHSVSCVVLAGEGDEMQRDYWYTQARDPLDLETVASVGQMAASRTLRRLGARPIKTGKYPVIFESFVSGSLLGSVIGALSGSSLYRKTSFLQNSLGSKRLAECINVHENPFVPKGFASGFYDAEGVATKERDVIKDGVIEGYFLGSYSARKLGMQTTGNAGGAHNLIMSHTKESLEILLKEMGTGLLITELMGQGVNLLTGDYSRGAAGFWVENGVIVHAVEEITLAGNLNQMLLGIVGVANDAAKRGSHEVGSILIDEMMVASNG